MNQMGLPLGQALTGMWSWELHRLADYIATRPDCDAARLFCAGLSGGGHQALWASALDGRIRATVVSGYLYGYKQALLEMYNGCSCNYVPHLWEHVDMGDIAALIAPRPLLVETGDADPLNGRDGVANVLRALEPVRHAYGLLDAPDAIRHCIHHGSHQWYGVGVAEWLRAVKG